jgi:hypothetical protein
MHPLLQRLFHYTAHGLSRPFFLWPYLDTLYHPTTVPGSDRLPKPPFIMVGNHGTFLDPWLIGRRSVRPVYYMCNDDAWRASPVTQIYLNSIGAFAKKKGGADFRAMKTTLRILAARSPVCIFPEGQTSWDGETQLIYMGLEKLVRKAGCPLVIFNLCGNFLMKPWWAERRRCGRVLMSVRKLTPQAMAALDDQELFQAIKQGIYHNDIKDERNRGDVFSGRDLALGLERFVWRCMQCGSEDRLVTSGNRVTCEACGSAWEMDACCRLRALTSGTACLADLKDWADAHRAYVIDKVKGAGGEDVLTRSADVMLQTVGRDGHTFQNQGTGQLSLTRDAVRFAPAEGRATQVLDFPLVEVHDTVIQKRDIFELRHGGAYYRFVFTRHSPMKWAWYVRYLNGYDALERRGYL